MESASSIFLSFFLLFSVLAFSTSQPTIQNSFWRNLDSPMFSQNKNKKSGNRNVYTRRHFDGNIRLTGSPRMTGLQRSVDMVLLELQEQTLDRDQLRQEMKNLQRHQQLNRRLLQQLTDSMNIVVKSLLKNPSSCDCIHHHDDDDDYGDESDGKYVGAEDVERQGGGGVVGDGGGRDAAGDRETGGRKKGRGEDRGEEADGDGVGGDDGSDAEENDILDYVRLEDSFPDSPDSFPQLAVLDRELMDQEGTGVTSPARYQGGQQSQASSQNPGPHSPRAGDQGAHGPFSGLGQIDQGGITTTPTTLTTSTTTTSTSISPDPILRLYNGSVPKDCDDIKALGYLTNGTYLIRPKSATKSARVICEFHETEAWTLIQRRLDGSQDFYKTWVEYKEGFGQLDGEFWIGNELLHHLTTQGSYRLKIDMWEWPRLLVHNQDPVSRYYYAESRHFFIDSEAERYTLHVPQDYFAYTGFGGSGLRIHRGPFLTKDVAVLPEGMRENCAQKFHCGWWFTTCVRNANFNGRYYKGGYANMKKKRRARDDIYWPNIDQSLYRVVMKVGRVS